MASASRPSEQRSSSPLFVAQTPSVATNPTEEVALIVHRYESQSKLSPTLAAIFKNVSHRELFLEVFTHHLELLKTRSQAFGDAQVTVFDKALLTLTRHNNESPGAFDLYLDEVVGVPQNGSFTSMESVLEKNVALKELLLKVAGSKIYTPQSSPAKQRVPSYPDTRGTRAQRQTIQSSSPFTLPSTRAIPAHIAPCFPTPFTQLLTTYQQAKIDYLTTEDFHTREKRLAARFLRDTAENAIGLLEQTPNHDKAIMEELRTVCYKANETASALSGGQTRKFDNKGFAISTLDSQAKQNDKAAGGGHGKHQGTTGRYDVEHHERARAYEYGTAPYREEPTTKYGGAPYQPKKKRHYPSTPYQRSGRLLDSYVPNPDHQDYGYDHGYERTAGHGRYAHSYQEDYQSHRDGRIRPQYRRDPHDRPSYQNFGN